MAVKNSIESRINQFTLVYSRLFNVERGISATPPPAVPEAHLPPTAVPEDVKHRASPPHIGARAELGVWGGGGWVATWAKNGAPVIFPFHSVVSSEN
jgi:hypothetical protein